MTVLAAKKELTEKETKTETFPVVASDIIYKGALVGVNAAGYAAPAAAESGAVFAGIALETVDNSSGGAGDLTVQVQCEGAFLIDGQTSLAQTDVGQPFYASDDATISKTQGSNEFQIGVMTKYVSATAAWFKLTPFA